MPEESLSPDTAPCLMRSFIFAGTESRYERKKRDMQPVIRPPARYYPANGLVDSFVDVTYNIIVLPSLKVSGRRLRRRPPQLAHQFSRGNGRIINPFERCGNVRFI